MIHLKADVERRCILIHLNTAKLPVLSRTLSKFLQAISHKVRPYRPEDGENVEGFEVLFVRVPQSKTIEETLLLQERAILNFLRDLGLDLMKINAADIHVETSMDPLSEKSLQISR